MAAAVIPCKRRRRDSPNTIEGIYIISFVYRKEESFFPQGLSPLLFNFAQTSYARLATFKYICGPFLRAAAPLMQRMSSCEV
jgi:hypothetical protein